MRRTLWLLLVAVTASLTTSPALAEQLTDAKFKELLRLLQPAKDAPWRTIPWRTALLDAQRNAAKEGKPIFIWAMDGHPLGCT